MLSTASRLPREFIWLDDSQGYEVINRFLSSLRDKLAARGVEIIIVLTEKFDRCDTDTHSSAPAVSFASCRRKFAERIDIIGEEDVVMLDKILSVPSYSKNGAHRKDKTGIYIKPDRILNRLNGSNRLLSVTTNPQCSTMVWVKFRAAFTTQRPCMNDGVCTPLFYPPPPVERASLGAMLPFFMSLIGYSHAQWFGWPM